MFVVAEFVFLFIYILEGYMLLLIKSLGVETTRVVLYYDRIV